MENFVETTQAKAHYKRRKLLINAKVQSIFLVYGVSLALFTLWIASEYRELFSRSAGNSRTVDASWLLSSSMSLPIVFSFCFGLSLFILAGIYISNLIVGPVYRLITHMDAISEGKEVTELTFRRMDFFQELLPSYNRFAKTLQTRTEDRDKK